MSFSFAGNDVGNAIANAANSTFAGVFGAKEDRNTQNAPLNDGSKFAFEAPKLPDLNIDNAYQTAQKYAQLSAQDAISNQVAAAQQLGNVAAQNYERKQNIDAQQAQNKSFGSPGFNTTPVSSSGKSAFGNWSGGTLQRQDFGNGLNNLQNTQDFNFQRQQAAESARAITTAEAAGDLARIEAQSMAQKRLVDAQNRADIFAAQNQAALAQNRAQQDQIFQRGESAADRASKERQAAMQAQASLYGSMFGSLSAPGANYRYWS